MKGGDDLSVVPGRCSAEKCLGSSIIGYYLATSISVAVTVDQLLHAFGHTKLLPLATVLLLLLSWVLSLSLLPLLISPSLFPLSQETNAAIAQTCSLMPITRFALPVS